MLPIAYPVLATSTFFLHPQITFHVFLLLFRRKSEAKLWISSPTPPPPRTDSWTLSVQLCSPDLSISSSLWGPLSLESSGYLLHIIKNDIFSDPDRPESFCLPLPLYHHQTHQRKMYNRYLSNETLQLIYIIHK